MKKVGIEAVGVKLPAYSLLSSDFARIYQQDPKKYSDGIGYDRMSLCMHQQDIVALTIGAVDNLLKYWQGAVNNIGLIIAATESSQDEARPLSASVLEYLNLEGNIRSYEVKHACYAGAAAIRQAYDWYYLHGSKANKVAMVITSDICLYNVASPAEATQGGGAIAFIIGEPVLCSIEEKSYPYSYAVKDFWRPFGQYFPHVRAKQSVEAYNKSLLACFAAYFKEHSKKDFADIAHFCFHTPFPKMVIKSFYYFLNRYNLYLDEQTIKHKITENLSWNRLIGNAYTSSLWISFLRALSRSRSKDKILTFSFGSGCGSEIILFNSMIEKSQEPIYWQNEIEKQLNEQIIITAEEYIKWRKLLEENNKNINYVDK